MTDITIKQQIMDLEQKIQASTDKVTELANRITQLKVGLSFNAVGETDAIYENEIDMDNLLRHKKSMEQQLSALYERSKIR